MKRNVIIIIFSILVVALISSCSSKPQNITEPTIYEQMQANKIEYVGDSSGVDRLLKLLPNFDQNYIQRFFSLQTISEPYGVTICYEPSEQYSGESMKVTAEMTTYAGYLFECIDNLGYIEFAYRLSSSNGNYEESAYELLWRVDRE